MQTQVCLKLVEAVWYKVFIISALAYTSVTFLSIAIQTIVQKISYVPRMGLLSTLQVILIVIFLNQFANFT